MSPDSPAANLTWRSRATAYALPIVTTAFTLWLVTLSSQGASDQPLLIVFLVPIIVSAYVGGFGPGLLAILLSDLGSSYYLLPPVHSFRMEGMSGQNRVALLFVGVLVTVLVHLLRINLRTARAANVEAGQLRAALDEHAIVAVTDAEGKISSVNDKFCVISGYRREELIGQDLRIINSAHHSATFMRDLWTTIRRGKVWHGEVKNRAKDGTFYWVDTTIVSVLNARRQPTRFLAIGADITARKSAEVAGVRLAAIVNSSDDAIVSKTLEGVITTWNPGAERIFGYTADEAVGKPMLMLFPPDRTAEEADILSRIGRGESVSHFETVRVTKSGQLLDVSVTLSPIIDHQGRIAGASTIARDITGRKRAERTAHEGEKRFKVMANTIPQLAWIAQADGYIIWYNDRWYDYTGTTPAEMEGWGWKIVHHAETLPAVIAQWNAAIAAGEVFEMEFPLRGRDGTFRRFLTRAQPIKDGEGRVSQWIGTNTDVDELRRSSDALRQSQAMYHSLVEQMPAGVFRKNADGRYVFVNSYFCRLRNVTADKFIGRLPGELDQVESRFVNEANSHHATIMLTGESIEVLDEYDRADGATLYFHVVKSPVYDGDGKIMGTQGVLFDVTANKRTELEIVRLNTELEQRVVDRTAQLESANKELEAFSYSVSHDLRAPLRAVNGFAEIMLEEFGPAVPAEGRRLLERIRHGGQRMGELIDDLLGFARLSRLPLNRRTVDTADLVRTVLDEFKPQWAGRVVEVRVASLSPSLGDHALLRQVWVNLISNALKYSRNRSPSVVEIGSKRVNDETVYFIADNGTGFDMKYAHKLFGVFQRLHRPDQFEGTGVGLAIVQRVVHRHGGRVWAEAVEDRGATFYFTLGTNKKL